MKEALKKELYKIKDISVVIPTYNRPQYLERNLSNLLKIKTLPYEILVVDQSEKDLSKKVCEKYKKKLKVPLKYLFSKVPSTSRAKNMGLKNADKRTKIVLFLDDDAYLLPNYLDKILEIYNNYPDAAGVKSFDFDKYKWYKNLSALKKTSFLIGQSIKKILLLGNQIENGFIINSPYGNSSPLFINKIEKAMWFPGTDQSFKKEVLQKISFDDHLIGWSLVEDIDITYRMSKAGYSLYETPFARLVHDHPASELAINQIIKRSYINQVMHYYFYRKNMPEHQIKYYFNLIVIFLLRFMGIFNPMKVKMNSKSFYYFLVSLAYTFKNRKKIAAGNIVIPKVG